MNLLVAGNSYIWPQSGDKLYICVSMHKVAGERGKKVFRHSNNFTKETILDQHELS